jgi:phage gpG-like protein
MTRHASILRREVYLAFYVEDHPMFQKYLMMGQSNGSFLGKKKNL